MTPFTLVIGPVLPATAFTSSKAMMPNTTSKDSGLALVTGVPSWARWTDDAMKNSMGIENSVLVREARPALASAPAAAGSASPPAAACSADAMTIFKRNRLNLTWIESFPVPEQKRTYLFFVEMEGHESDLRVRRAITTLEQKTLQLKILGSYPVTEPVE